MWAQGDKLLVPRWADGLLPRDLTGWRLAVQIRALTREELAEWWKLYVAALDKQLSAADGAAPDTAPAPDAASQLAMLQREALSLLTRCCPSLNLNHSPTLCQGWLHSRRKPSRACCSAGSLKWPKGTAPIAQHLARKIDCCDFWVSDESLHCGATLLCDRAAIIASGCVLTRLTSYHQ